MECSIQYNLEFNISNIWYVHKNDHISFIFKLRESSVLFITIANIQGNWQNTQVECIPNIRVWKAWTSLHSWKECRIHCTLDTFQSISSASSTLEEFARVWNQNSKAADTTREPSGYCRHCRPQQHPWKRNTAGMIFSNSYLKTHIWRYISYLTVQVNSIELLRIESADDYYPIVASFNLWRYSTLGLHEMRSSHKINSIIGTRSNKERVLLEAHAPLYLFVIFPVNSTQTFPALTVFWPFLAHCQHSFQHSSRTVFIGVAFIS